MSGCPRRAAQGAGPNDNNPPPAPSQRRDREALGRSRGGLTTKIHLLADRRCRPVARVTTAGQRHDSLAFEPLMNRLRIARAGPAVLVPGPVGSSATRRTRTRRSVLTCGDAESPPPSPSRPTRSPTASNGAAKAGGHLPSMRSPTKIATPPSVPSTSSRPSAQWPCAPTNATTSTGAPLTSPRSRSGSATPSTKIHETRPSRPPSQPVVHPHDRSRPADHPDSLSLARGSALRR